MKTVYLTSGPRGAGKSTYVSTVQKLSPDVIVVDRDEFLKKEFGTVGFDPDSGMHLVAAELFKQEIVSAINSAEENSRIIIDAWNGFAVERNHFLRTFRKLGVDFIVCWYFVTPLETCLEWSKQKPECAGISEGSVKWDWELYHEKATDINYPGHEIYRPEIDEFHFSSEKFDMILRINPLQLTLPGVALI